MKMEEIEGEKAIKIKKVIELRSSKLSQKKLIALFLVSRWIYQFLIFIPSLWMSGCGVGGLLGAVHAFNTGIPYVQKHIKGPKWLPFLIRVSSLLMLSVGSALFGVSPYGLLLQSSTVADSVSFSFSDGVTKSVPCSYIEFAERLVLPQFKDLLEGEVKEFHRRDGFEVGNADKIFESTSKNQLTQRSGSMFEL